MDERYDQVRLQAVRERLTTVAVDCGSEHGRAELVAKEKRELRSKNQPISPADEEHWASRGPRACASGWHRRFKKDSLARVADLQ